MATKAVGLTKRQADLLDFLKRHYTRSRAAPTYREMQAALGLASKSGVHRLVHALEQRGFIHHVPGKARAIALTQVSTFECHSHNVILPSDVEAQLQTLAHQTKIPPQRIIAEAVRSYIMECA